MLNCSPNTLYPKHFKRLTASRAMNIPMNLNPYLYRERQAPLKCYPWCKCEPWKLLFSFIDWQRWNRLIMPSAGWSPPDAPIPQHPGGWDLPLTSAHSLALTLLSTLLPYSHFPTPSHSTPTLQRLIWLEVKEAAKLTPASVSKWLVEIQACLNVFLNKCLRKLER